MKKIYLLLVAGTVLTACGGSGNNPKNQDAVTESTDFPEEKSVSMTFEEGLQYKEAKNKLVEIEGYVQLSAISNFSDNGQTVSFFGRRNQKEGIDYYTTMPVGNGANHMKKLPLEYKSSDVKMLDINGKVVLANERVKLTGHMYSVNGTHYLDVTDIEKVPEVKIDYEVLKFPTLLEKQKTDDKAFDKEYQLEGKLSIPMYVLVDDESTVDLKDKSGKTFSLQLITGTGAGQIEKLKEGWTPKDVKIRNGEGNLINTNKNVKVYGVLKLDGLHVEEIVQ